MNFYDLVYQRVREIPAGKVSTYGRIAALCGKMGAARAVGNALHHNPEPGVTPCHRVVNHRGELTASFAFGGIEAHKQLLEKEGVHVNDDFTVDLKTYLH